jgi:hypothetical protein
MKNTNNIKENKFKNLRVISLSIIVLIFLAAANVSAGMPIVQITQSNLDIYPNLYKQVCTCGGVCCNSTQYCGTDNVCHEKKAIGYSCSNDYECLSGNCLNKLCKAGDACDTNADCKSTTDAAVTKYCGADNTCHSQKPNGEACSANYQCTSNNCYKNTICEPSGFCGEDADCGSGKYCGTDNKCYPKKDNNADCSLDNECKSSHCISGKCLEPTCGTSVCTDAQYCENNACKQKKASGEACKDSAECTDNFCVHNVCRSEAAYCGDGFCDTGESISSCPGDCGECGSGETKDCTAENGCDGTMTCSGGKWSDCVTALKKCADGECLQKTEKCPEDVKSGKKAEADSLMQQAQAALNSGNYETAKQKASDAKEIYTEIGDVNSLNEVNSLITNISNLDKGIFEKIIGAILSPIGIILIIIIILIVIIFFVFKFLGKPAKISLKVNPDHIPANGKTAADIIVRLSNKIGGEVSTKEDIIVDLAAGSGTIKPNRVTILKGKSVGTSAITSSSIPEIVDVTANCPGLEEGKTKVTFTSVSAKFCMHCGAKLIVEGDPCPKCGKLPPSGTDTKVCQNSDCGEVISKQARYCRKCGAAQP